MRGRWGEISLYDGPTPRRFLTTVYFGAADPSNVAKDWTVTDPLGQVHLRPSL